MRIRTFLALALPCAMLLTAAAIHRSQGQRSSAPAATNHAREPLQLVAAHPFVLDEAFTHNWRKERPAFQAGYLLVLRADPAFLRSRQSAEPVLYVGSETAARLNNPMDSGHLVCLVPAPVNQNAEVDLDPTSTPIWFGTPELPERIDAARAKLELSQALALGVLAPGPILGSAKSRTAQGGSLSSETIYMRNRDQLDLIIADLVQTYSPNEIDLIESLRMPLTR